MTQRKTKKYSKANNLLAKDYSFLFGAHIEALINKHWHMSMRKLAEAIGYSPTGFNNLLERDDVKAGVIARLSKVMGLPVSEFFAHLKDPELNMVKDETNLRAEVERLQTEVERLEYENALQKKLLERE